MEKEQTSTKLGSDKIPQGEPKELPKKLPRHWVDLEELDPAYWANPKNLEKRGQEFLDKPIDTIEMIDKFDKKGIERREFLTIMGASMALASLGFARKPVNKIIPYVVKPAEITPGIPTWYASTYNDGLQSYGILIKNREGRPIKLEGNPDHPVNSGKLSIRGQGSLLGLYDPDRLKSPVAVSNGEKRNVTWSEVNTELQKVFRKAASGSGRVRVLSGYRTSPSTSRLVSEFVSAFRSGRSVQYQPGVADHMADANAASYGERSLSQYHFDRADVIVSLGSDFLQSGISPVEHTAQWSKRRKLGGSRSDLSKFYAFESTVTLTGANADERFAVQPGDEIKVALAVVHDLVIRQGRSSFGSYATLRSTLNDYSPDKVASEIGGKLTKAKIQEVASNLWKARGKSLVVGGSLHSATDHSLALLVAVNLLNEILGNEGSTVGSSGVRLESGVADYERLLSDMSAGKVDVLVVHRANPAYFDKRFAAAAAKVEDVIVVSDRLDETAQGASFVLPDHHALENWGDAQTRSGMLSLQQPALHPLHDTWAFEDMILKWIRGAGLSASGLAGQTARSESKNTWYDYLRANWRGAVYSKFGSGRGFEAFWVGALKKGVVGRLSSARARRFRTSALATLPKYRASLKRGSSSFVLALYEKAAIGDGSTANNAWCQELPDPVSTVTWDNYANLAPSTAKKLGVRENDVIKISAAGASRELSVHLQPGMHPNVISIAVGYGRTAAGRVGNGVGVNAYAFSNVKGGRFVYSGHAVDSVVRTGRRHELAKTQGHHRTEGRPIVNDITLAAYQADPTTENHTSPHLRLKNLQSIWPKHKYPGYRWGMAIDLTSCTGCSACVLACQAENNIPVVGKERVKVSREMHWIRIDRYYSGSADEPDLLFQPMLCQHCENASCETVCPVLATVHSDEGLNEMVYNRCVGTRYCQNNCPYKVRRFNFFDHWHAYEKPMNLVWNPDVTVRTRGVMEKCTFCVQRIQVARDAAKAKGRKIQDGEVVPACQQTCPTDAIAFGDINNPTSRVSRQQREPRAFVVLEELNNQPSISYLSKVRNKEKGASHVHHDDHS